MNIFTLLERNLWNIIIKDLDWKSIKALVLTCKYLYTYYLRLPLELRMQIRNNGKKSYDITITRKTYESTLTYSNNDKKHIYNSISINCTLANEIYSTLDDDSFINEDIDCSNEKHTIKTDSWYSRSALCTGESNNCNCERTFPIANAYEYREELDKEKEERAEREVEKINKVDVGTLKDIRKIMLDHKKQQNKNNDYTPDKDTLLKVYNLMYNMYTEKLTPENLEEEISEYNNSDLSLTINISKYYDKIMKLHQNAKDVLEKHIKSSTLGCTLKICNLECEGITWTFKKNYHIFPYNFSIKMLETNKDGRGEDLPVFVFMEPWNNIYANLEQQFAYRRIHNQLANAKITHFYKLYYEKLLDTKDVTEIDGKNYDFEVFEKCYEDWCIKDGYGYETSTFKYNTDKNLYIWSGTSGNLRDFTRT